MADDKLNTGPGGKKSRRLPKRHLPGCQVSVVQSQDPAGSGILLLGDVLCNRKPQLPVCNGLRVSIQQRLNECEPLLRCRG